jgi:hypothetical protein
MLADADDEEASMLEESFAESSFLGGSGSWEDDQFDFGPGVAPLSSGARDVRRPAARGLDEILGESATLFDASGSAAGASPPASPGGTAGPASADRFLAAPGAHRRRLGPGAGGAASPAATGPGQKVVGPRKGEGLSVQIERGARGRSRRRLGPVAAGSPPRGARGATPSPRASADLGEESFRSGAFEASTASLDESDLGGDSLLGSVDLGASGDLSASAASDMRHSTSLLSGSRSMTASMASRASMGSRSPTSPLRSIRGEVRGSPRAGSDGGRGSPRGGREGRRKKRDRGKRRSSRRKGGAELGPVSVSPGRRERSKSKLDSPHHHAFLAAQSPAPRLGALESPASGFGGRASK